MLIINFTSPIPPMQQSIHVTLANIHNIAICSWIVFVWYMYGRYSHVCLSNKYLLTLHAWKSYIKLPQNLVTSDTQTCMAKILHNMITDICCIHPILHGLPLPGPNNNQDCCQTHHCSSYQKAVRTTHKDENFQVQWTTHKNFGLVQMQKFTLYSLEHP